MANKKCYNSGKIGGLPYLVAYKNFTEADRTIEGLGFVPVNPMNNGLQYSAPWVLHMVVDIWNMLHCRHVLFQENWKQSKGARIEYRIARFFGKDLIFI